MRRGLRWILRPISLWRHFNGCQNAGRGRLGGDESDSRLGPPGREIRPNYRYDGERLADAQLSLQIGMDAHLTKPVEPECLYETLESLIRDDGPEREEDRNG